MSDIWESVWDLLSETFRRVGTALRSSYPDMTWSCGHTDNRAFPFRSYATFNRGGDDSEDVVISVDFHRSSDEQLRYSVDIGLDDGPVLADGPTGFIAVSEGLRSAESEIRAAVDSIIVFLETSEQVVRDAMK
jgi:hypothetical protein